MKEAKGNLWYRAEADVIVITTNGNIKKNGCCVMGRGCALEARKLVSGIDRKLGEYLKEYGNRCFRLGNLSFGAEVWSMPVKHNWWEKADIELIKTSASQLMEMADKFEMKNIYLPRPGCGNGGLKWEDVQPILDKCLDDRFTCITF